jgi:hypothetical protein
MRPYTKKSTICCATSRQTLATAGDGALSLEPEMLLLDVLDAVAAPGASMVQFYCQGEACESLQDIAASLEKSEGYVKGTKWRAAQALQWSFHHAFDAISREAWRVFCQRHQENSALSQAVRAWCASPVA